MRRLLAVGVALAALPLAGCGTGDDAQQARQVVQRFYAAVGHHDGAGACAQLSTDTAQALESQSGQSCRAVITRLSYDGGPVVATHVFATSAKVDLRGGDSAFLDREPEGWRLSAVGCQPKDGKPHDRPFECEAQA